MPFYLRKSISAGPFRFNLSKSGVGLSVGVKGLRIGTGPRGHYIHAGRGGVYYRATLGKSNRTSSVRQEPSQRPVKVGDDHPLCNGVEMIDIESGDVQEMKDAAFDDVLAEINRKQTQVRASVVLTLSAFLCAATAVFVLGPQGLIAVALVLPAWGIGRWLDSFSRCTVLFYDLDESITKNYEKVAQSFDALSKCAGKWHITAGGSVKDLTTWKQNAGASHLVKKNSNSVSYKLPSVIKSNVTPPSIGVGKQTVYFFPEIVLVEDGQKIGAIGYGNLSLRWQTSNFIEEGKVPHDAKVVGHTWKHPNKSGGPDRRFKNNYKIPICVYEVLHLSSNSGLNEMVEFSRLGLAGPFVRAVELLQTPQKTRLALTGKGRG